jgi:succinate-semialdehyde dehydrogenase/glutarate-semialdehyde dehydrogenase
MLSRVTMETPTRLWIDGRWREGDGTFPVVDPATEETLAEVASASEDDARAAVDAAARAFPAWAARPPRERAEILRRAFELMDARKEEFARLMTLENGKALPDARAEAAYAAEFFRWYADGAARIAGVNMRSPHTGARILTNEKPAGVAVMITPWNFPAAMGTRKIAPALAAGCACVVKPASATPLTMLALMPLLEEAGVPPGVVNVVPSRSAGRVVNAMLADRRVRVVSFTGSTEVGRTLLKASADCVHTPAMELGGNAPLIVFEDADIEQAVQGAMLAKMRNGGEACTAANRFYVHERVHDAFAGRLVEAFGELKMGHGLDDGVTLGPLVNAETRDKVARLVDDAREKGARALCGGRAPEGRGFFYEPTVLTHVPEAADCLREEIFGPVAAIQTFRDEDEAVARANDTEFGLVAYLFTGDLKRGLRVAERLEAGMVGLNRGLVSDPAAPFGGVKQSGIGREGAEEGLKEFLETQYVAVEW